MNIIEFFKKNFDLKSFIKFVKVRMFVFIYVSIIAFVIRCLLYPLFWILVKLDKFDKYRLCTIGYYGFTTR